MAIGNVRFSTPEPLLEPFAGDRRTRAGARWGAADAFATVSPKHSLLLKCFVAAFIDGERAVSPARMRGSLTMPESPLSCCIVQQPKGGDPVSHCLSPRSPASLSWIVTSTEVRA